MSAPKPVRLTVATANIGRGVSTAVARKNIALVMRRWPAASIGWQEIDDDDRAQERDVLHNYLAKVSRAVESDDDVLPRASVDGLRAVGWWTKCPIFVTPGWRIVERHVDQTCEGDPGWSPHRVCVQALLEHEATGYRLVRLNGHYPRPGDGHQWLWDECDARWQAIARHWRARGYTTITTRDTNERKRHPLIPGERLLLGAGIDKITYVPGSLERGVRLERAAPGRRVNLTIDGHDALGLALIVKAPKEFARS